MKTNKITLPMISIILVITWSCEKRYSIQDEVFPVQATVETAAVPTTDDTADDPCIWIHP
ncbi:MAG: phytase, partial [Fidelibacterota bacterium]